MKKLHDPSTLPPIALTWLFLRIGATAFGGLGAALVLLERELIHKRHLLVEAELAESLTYTKLLPGSTVVQVVSYLGYKLGGWPGSALATIAFLLPSALAMLLLSALYVAVAVLPNVGPTINGLTATVVGILLATTYRLGKANSTTPLTRRITLASFVVAAVLNVNAAVIVLICGLIGIILLAPSHSGRR
ncbi:MAG: chromate transporter [Thermomicrobiales bacterium]